MKKPSRILLAAASLAILGAGAQAQTANPSAPVETITVIAPYLVMEKSVPAAKTNPRQRLFTVSLLGEANYGDLDLSKPEGGVKLKERVRDTATRLCQRIEKEYPSAGYVPVTDQDCVKTAVDDAMTAVNILIAAYRRG